jgi:hypothetical protein
VTGDLMNRAIACVLLVATAACSESRGEKLETPLETPGQFCEALVNAASTRAVECDGATAEDVAQWRQSDAATCAIVEESARAGRVQYDRAKARGCLDLIELGTCAERLKGWWGFVPECTTAVFPAAVSIGAFCSWGYECMDGRCPGGALSLRTCYPWQGVGQPCRGPQPPCVAGEACMLVGTTGDDCAPGLICVDELCSEQTP